MHAESDAEACMIADVLLTESKSAIVEVSREDRVIYSTGKHA